MSRIAGFLVLLVTLAPHARGQAPVRQPQALSHTVIIRGRIVSADTEAPVRKAVVTLTSDVAATRPGDPVYSDDEGRFEFTGVPPGRYAVSAWKSGYATALFGAQSSREPPVHIVARAGSIVAGVQIALQRGAAIAGRVTDEFGDPVTDISVRVSRVAIVGGRLRFGRGATAVDTDDHGEYRIGGLAAGSYVVSAVGFVALAPAPGESHAIATRFGGRLWESTFYPEARHQAQAKPVALAAGEQADGVDMRLTAQSSSLITVSGRIVDAAASAADGFLLTVSTVATAGDLTSGGNMSRSIPASGEFAVPLEAGDYLLTARDFGGGQIAAQRVSVDESDISGVQLTLGAGARVHGRVVFDGAAPRENRVTIAALPTDDGLRVIMPPSAISDASGAFTLTGLLGQREIAVLRAPAGWTMETITSAGRDVADMPIDFVNGENLRDVLVTLTNHPTEVSGTLRDDQQRPLQGVSVIVFAEDRRQLAHRARWVRPDIAGRFAIAGLPPGEYLAVTATGVDDIGWQSAEYLEPLRSRAVHVTLTAGTKTTIDLPWSAGR